MDILGLFRFKAHPLNGQVAIWTWTDKHPNIGFFRNNLIRPLKRKEKIWETDKFCQFYRFSHPLRGNHRRDIYSLRNRFQRLSGKRLWTCVRNLLWRDKFYWKIGIKPLDLRYSESQRLPIASAEIEFLRRLYWSTEWISLQL